MHGVSLSSCATTSEFIPPSWITEMSGLLLDDAKYYAFKDWLSLQLLPAYFSFIYMFNLERIIISVFAWPKEV